MRCEIERRNVLMEMGLAGIQDVDVVICLLVVKVSVGYLERVVCKGSCYHRATELKDVWSHLNYYYLRFIPLKN